MRDILSLKMYDVIGIIKRSNEKAKQATSKHRISRRTKYHDDMIRRGREERAKARRLEANKMNKKTTLPKGVKDSWQIQEKDKDKL